MCHVLRIVYAIFFFYLSVYCVDTFIYIHEIRIVLYEQKHTFMYFILGFTFLHTVHLSKIFTIFPTMIIFVMCNDSKNISLQNISLCAHETLNTK